MTPPQVYFFPKRRARPLHEYFTKCPREGPVHHAGRLPAGTYFTHFTFSLQNLNLYHSPHTSPLKYKNSLSHLNTGRSYAFPSLYKMQKESFHMLYYFRFFFINNKSLNSSKAISFPALFKRTTSNTSE